MVTSHTSCLGTTTLRHCGVTNQLGNLLITSYKSRGSRAPTKAR